VVRERENGLKRRFSSWHDLQKGRRKTAEIAPVRRAIRHISRRGAQDLPEKSIRKDDTAVR